MGWYVIKRWWMALVLSVILLLPPVAIAGVNLTYPGRYLYIFGDEDKTLPGIPSKEINEYKEELRDWSNQASVPLYTDSLSLVGNALYNGLDADITALDFNDATSKLIPKDLKIWEMMRDIIFLESMQKSIKYMDANYIDTFYSEGSLSPEEIYRRASSMQKQYDVYVSSTQRNVLLAAIFHSGKVDYRYALDAYGEIKSAYDDAIGARDNFNTMIKGLSLLNQRFSGKIYDFKPYKEYILDVSLDIAKDLVGDTYKNYYEQMDTPSKLMFDNIGTAVSSLSSGGFGLLVAPAVIIGTDLNYLATSLLEASKGAHFLNHYYLTKTGHFNALNTIMAPDPPLDPSPRLFVIDFVKLNTNNELSVAAKSDKIIQALQDHDYAFNSIATDKEAVRAYAMSSLFNMVRDLDIAKMKQNIVARVKLEELQNHGFNLQITPGSSINRHTIQLPSFVVNNSQHSGVPASVTYTINRYELFSNYPDAVSNRVNISSTDLAATFSFDQSIYSWTKSTLLLSCTVSYSDGFTMTSDRTLYYTPEISGLLLTDGTSANRIESTGTSRLKVEFCGDEAGEATLSYHNVAQSTDKTYFETFTLGTSNEIYRNGSCKRYTLDVDGARVADLAGLGQIKISARVAGRYSYLTLPAVDPNDTDGNGIPDDWEMKYFGNLDQKANGDKDGDGASNYQEWQRNTDPTKTGTEEILTTVTLKPHLDGGGTPVNTFYLSGDVYSHLSLEGGTLDLRGHTLIVHGDFNNSYGEVKLNGGKLIVKGNYRGAGVLTMTNPADYMLVEKDFYSCSMGRYSYYGSPEPPDPTNLTAGTLEVLGNFTYQGNTSYVKGLFCSGTHRVLLSGASKQTVTFSSSGQHYSHFNVLEITNTSSDGVELNGVATADLISHNVKMKLSLSWLSLAHDETVNGALSTIGATDLNSHNLGAIDLNGHTLTFNGDLFLNYGSNLNLGGGRLGVNGNLYHSGGDLKVNGGQLIVKGDYRIQTRNVDGSFGPGSGKLVMTNNNDYVLVSGNFVTEGRSTNGTELAAGTLEVKGNFTSLFSGYSDFYARGTHRVLLSGTTKQTISFENINNWNSRFNILEITNSSVEGVECLTPISVHDLFSHNVKLSSLTITGNNVLSLSHDEVINGNLSIVYDYSDVDLQGHTLTVNGNLIHSGSSIKVNGGRLVVTGDYRMQTKNADGSFGPSDSFLVMTNPSDYVLVHGNFVRQSYYSTDNLLSAGTLEVKGNFSTLNLSDSFCDGDSAFFPTGTHRVLFSGTTKQTVNFACSFAEKFNILEITNSSPEGVVFASYVIVTTLFNHHNNKFTITSSYYSAFPDYDGDSVRDDKDTQPTNPLISGPYKTLSLTISGTGGGSVNSVPSGIACTASCSGTFEDGKSVAISALADSVSTFTGWSGACSGKGDCVINMSADRSVTAIFTAADRARIVGGIGYSTLSAACSAATNGATIRALDAALGENITITKPLVLVGGYNPAYGSRTGDTELKGLAIGAGGVLTVDGLVVK